MRACHAHNKCVRNAHLYAESCVNPMHSRQMLCVFAVRDIRTLHVHVAPNSPCEMRAPGCYLLWPHLHGEKACLKLV
jgi:hypothetical protein